MAMCSTKSFAIVLIILGNKMRNMTAMRGLALIYLKIGCTVKLSFRRKVSSNISVLKKMVYKRVESIAT